MHAYSGLGEWLAPVMAFCLGGALVASLLACGKGWLLQSFRVVARWFLGMVPLCIAGNFILVIGQGFAWYVFAITFYHI